MVKKILVVLMVVAFSCSFMLFTASCAKKAGQVEQVAKPDSGKPAVTPKAGDDDAARKARAAAEAKRRAEREAAARLRAQMDTFENKKIYFDFDKSELKPQAKASLTEKAQFLRSNPEFSVRIDGHCDERGTNEYNLALGERRAEAAFKFLNALGISGSRMQTRSYGEEMPADPGHSEGAWAQNRRDEFKLIK